MPSAITETPTKGTPISAPVGADLRTAASVRTPFQAVGNRLAFLEQLFDAFTWAADAVWTVADGKMLKIRGDEAGAQSGVFDLSRVITKFDKLVTGALFQNGYTGRANKKPVTLPAQGANVTGDPTLHDVWDITPTAAINFTVDPAGTYVTGESCRIVNRSQVSGRKITVKNPAGTTIGEVLHNSNSDFPRYVDVLLNENGDWVVYGHGSNSS
jgi:hypothetical protein